MLKASSRWLLVYLVLFGIMGSYSAFAATLTDFPGSPFGGVTWVWTLDLGGGVLFADDQLVIQNDSGHDWSLPGGWTASAPEGWSFWKNPLIHAENEQGVTALIFEIDNLSKATGGLFSVTAVGSFDDTGTWTLGNGARTLGSGSLSHVPQVPEAGTLSLLAAGLLAGVLLKWRKKEMD